LLNVNHASKKNKKKKILENRRSRIVDLVNTSSLIDWTAGYLT